MNKYNKYSAQNTLWNIYKNIHECIALTIEIKYASYI